jgi:hypothetical protein
MTKAVEPQAIPQKVHRELIADELIATQTEEAILNKSSLEMIFNNDIEVLTIIRIKELNLNFLEENSDPGLDLMISLLAQSAFLGRLKN